MKIYMIFFFSYCMRYDVLFIINDNKKKKIERKYVLI